MNNTGAVGVAKKAVAPEVALIAVKPSRVVDVSPTWTEVEPKVTLEVTHPGAVEAPVERRTYPEVPGAINAVVLVSDW